MEVNGSKQHAQEIAHDGDEGEDYRGDCSMAETVECFAYSVPVNVRVSLVPQMSDGRDGSDSGK